MDLQPGRLTTRSVRACVPSSCSRHGLELSAISAWRRRDETGRDDNKIGIQHHCLCSLTPFLRPLLLYWMLANMAGGGIICLVLKLKRSIRVLLSCTKENISLFRKSDLRDKV